LQEIFTILYSPSESAARHVSRLALVLVVALAHPHPGHASVHQAGSVSHHARSGAHHGQRRPDQAPTLGDKLVAFALSQQGQQVGSGECFDLAMQGLTKAGARSAYMYGDVTPDADYVWGRPVRLADAQPGDVLQFRNFRVVKHIITTTQLPDGRLYRTQTEAMEERDHHTAIVERSEGNVLSILEQNVDPGGRVVQRNRIDVASHTENEMNEAEASQITTDVEVEGDVRAYRPQKATATELARVADLEQGLGSGGSR